MNWMEKKFRHYRVLCREGDSRICVQNLQEFLQKWKQRKKIVWQNITLAFVVKGIVLILGAGGLATMWEAVFADVGVALLAILNAVRIQRMKFWQTNAKSKHICKPHKATHKPKFAKELAFSNARQKKQKNLSTLRKKLNLPTHQTWQTNMNGRKKPQLPTSVWRYGGWRA